VTSWIDAFAAGMPALFLALVVWWAARLAMNGDITVGELVAVYGYAAVLTTPISFFIEGINDLGRGIVAAGRLTRFLALQPDTHDQPKGVMVSGEAELFDPDTGLVVRPGRQVVVVATRLADALALTDRLARLVESDVRYGTVRLADIAIADVRSMILLAENDGYVFGGRLRDVLGGSTPAQADPALHAAVATDIVRALPDGFDAYIRPRAANLSGGQRQRLQLARCLIADPRVLILVEPTSAVDAHTEALVVDRVTRLRAERTTVVVTSALRWLDSADDVVFLVDGRITATGSHLELLSGHPAYRAFVLPDAAAAVSESVPIDSGAVAG
jgi:ABC-type bacteriocin/lantibiotic exporter with double-glycine peptidase domain